MRRSFLAMTALVVSIASCNDNLAFTAPSSDLFVVEAYLYAGERVTDVTVTRVLPIDADSADTASSISDASIVLTRGSQRFTLVPTTGKAGHYEYPGSDLTIGSGDEFHIEVTVGSRTATAATIVPAAPSGLSLSSATLDVDTTFVPGPGTGPPPFDALTIRWSNSARLYHFVATENIETNPKKIPTPAGFGFILKRISAPTTVDSALVAAPEFGYYGRYRVKLYRVGEEYVNLYRGRQQDSRDLNEPPTNISGALGIFAAFAADSAFFVVR